MSSQWESDNTLETIIKSEIETVKPNIAFEHNGFEMIKIEQLCDSNQSEEILSIELKPLEINHEIKEDKDRENDMVDFYYENCSIKREMEETNCQNNLYSCPYCTKSSNKYGTIYRHLKSCHSDKKNSSPHFVNKKVFECSICKEKFEFFGHRNLHVLKHCENKVYKCPHCTKVFKKYGKISRHIKTCHGDKHSCPHCAKMFPALDRLKMHLLRHSDHREFLCTDCGKQFKRKDKLKEHYKKMHSEERKNDIPRVQKSVQNLKKNNNPKVEPTDFHRFIYKCHQCLVGFKRRGMLVNHLAKRHPDINPDSVSELNSPILQTTRDYFCQQCDKVYKSNSKLKIHILKKHPGTALPTCRKKQGDSDSQNFIFSEAVGSVAKKAQSCKWCHKQYATKAKLLQHQRKAHTEQLAQEQKNSEDESDELCQQKQKMCSQVIEAKPNNNNVLKGTCLIIIQPVRLAVTSVVRMAPLNSGNS